MPPTHTSAAVELIKSLALAMLKLDQDKTQMNSKMYYQKYCDLLDGVRGEFDMYWSDVSSLQAKNLLRQFTTQDWQALTFAIPQQNTIWLTACTETLSEIEWSLALSNILETLLDIPGEQPQIATLDTIYSHMLQGIEIPTSLLQKVQNVIPKIQYAGLTTQTLIHHLKARLG